VFLCQEPDPTVSVESYRRDWGEIWSKWFDRGMEGDLDLPLFSRYGG